MKLITAILATCSIALASSPTSAQEPPRPVRADARQQAPAALLGVWKVDVAASQFGSTPPQEAFRTFSYTEDGKLMVAFLQLNADGTQSSGHWWLQLDGTPGYEYESSNGSTPYAVIQLRPGENGTLELTNSRYGEVRSRTQYVVSPDGQTFTMIRNPGAANEARVLYRRWGA